MYVALPQINRARPGNALYPVTAEDNALIPVAVRAQIPAGYLVDRPRVPLRLSHGLRHAISNDVQLVTSQASDFTVHADCSAVDAGASGKGCTRHQGK